MEARVVPDENITLVFTAGQVMSEVRVVRESAYLYMSPACLDTRPGGVGNFGLNLDFKYSSM